MRSLKILSVFLLSLGLVGATGGGTLVAAADSHATHFASLKGPGLEQNEDGCTTCHAAGNVQCGEAGPFFQPGDGAIDQDEDGNFNLSETKICDPCHSPDGAFPGASGLDDPDIGAKANWPEGVYEPDGTLKDGKEKWCATCHDDDPANSKVDGSGIDAPNVIGADVSDPADGVIDYGYYASGHGRLDVLPMSDINLECEECHDLTRPHIDHDPRTYEVREIPPPPVAIHPYQESYRLNGRLDVPRMSHHEGEFQLCMRCHEEVFEPSNYFRYDRTPEPTLLHRAHTVFSYPQMMWDSDYDGAWIGGRTGDSTASCPTCHNVHGSPMDLDPNVGGETDLHPNPAMIRHGELLGGSELNGLRFLWYTEVGGSTGLGVPTADRLLSKSGELWTNPPSCGQPQPCHSSQPHYNRDAVPDIIIDDFESYTNDAGLQAVWDNSRDAKAPRLEPQSTGATGPDGSQCMRVRIKWTRTTYDHGALVREYAPYIDATGKDFFGFYVKLNNNAKIERIQVRLKKYEGAVCIANFYTSELENGVWKLVSIPRSSFSDTTWGKLSEIRFRIYEWNPSSSWTHDVYFDDIRFTQ